MKGQPSRKLRGRESPMRKRTFEEVKSGSDQSPNSHHHSCLLQASVHRADRIFCLPSAAGADRRTAVFPKMGHVPSVPDDGLRECFLGCHTLILSSHLLLVCHPSPLAAKQLSKAKATLQAWTGTNESLHRSCCSQSPASAPLFKICLSASGWVGWSLWNPECSIKSK